VRFLEEIFNRSNRFSFSPWHGKVSATCDAPLLESDATLLGETSKLELVMQIITFLDKHWNFGFHSWLAKILRKAFFVI